MFSEAERQIFEFFDGERNRKVDPIAVYRRLVAQQEIDYLADAQLADTGDMEAMGRVLKVAREAFNVREFADDPASGGTVGLLDTEVIDVLRRFGEYLGDLSAKKNGLPTSGSPAVSAGAPEGSPTRTSSDSGSTGIA